MIGEKKSKQNEEDEKPYNCTGCNTPLGKYDETCPHCERLNPNYILR